MTIADQIFERRAKAVEPKRMADLFQRLVWLMDDNGNEICKTMREWIESDNLEKVQIALEFTEVFYFQNRAEMLQTLTKTTSRYPQLRSRCDELIATWDKNKCFII